MHASSFENMEHALGRLRAAGLLDDRRPIRVLDVGSLDVNGSYRQLFERSAVDYVGADLDEGPNVDVVLSDPYTLPFPDRSIDVVVSGQMLEHCEFFWRSFQEMTRVLADDGFLILIAPSAGPAHQYPVDCYRFYPDAYQALAKLGRCHLIDWRLDERGPWHDLVGIFSRRPRELPPRPDREPTWLPPPEYPRHGDAERRAGEHSYLDVLASIHEVLAPRSYLEIGVRRGRSLALARCPSVAVDPMPELDEDPVGVQVFAETSDDFFEFDADMALPEPPDLAFIDGMHWFEFSLRDFMNIERRSHPATVVVLDDVFPCHPLQAERLRQTHLWSGDVWKMVDCLRRYRPDLLLLPIDADPCGLLVIAGLDPENRTLWDRYNPIVREYVNPELPGPPLAVLRREGALNPKDRAIRSTLKRLRRARGGRRSPWRGRSLLRPR